MPTLIPPRRADRRAPGHVSSVTPSEGDPKCFGSCSFFNYANGVSLDDGEAWYHGPHAQELKSIPGVQRYRSWRALKVPENISRVMSPPEDDYVRRSEVWFDSYEAWEASRECWVASQDGAPGFRGLDAIFVADEPEYDLLRDVPPEHYKYIAWPIQWRGGVPPEVEDSGDTVLYSYFVRRPAHVSSAKADDWYLGHHTREGKQMPSIQTLQNLVDD